MTDRTVCPTAVKLIHYPIDNPAMPHRQVHPDIAKPLGPLTWPMGLTVLRLLLLPVFLGLLQKEVPYVAEGHHGYRHAAIAIFG